MSPVPETVCERVLIARASVDRISLPRSGEVGDTGPGLGGRVELEDEEEEEMAIV